MQMRKIFSVSLPRLLQRSLRFSFLFKMKRLLSFLAVVLCFAVNLTQSAVIPRHQDVCGKHKNVNEFSKRLDESRNENYDEDCIPRFGLIGDVKDVAKGAVTSKANSTEYQLRRHHAGFGFGAIGDSLQGLGEAVFVNGMAIIRSTDNSKGSNERYFQSVVGKRFRSTFGIILLNDCPGDIEVTFDSSPSKNTTLESFHKTFYDDLDQSPFCYFGVADFTFLEGNAIAKAPINGENVFDTVGYYGRDPLQLENQLAYIAGCVADLNSVRSAKLGDKLAKVFPGKRGLQFRAHGVTLKRCVEHGDQIKEDDIDGVFELTDKSKMMSYNFNVYKLDRNKKLTEL